MYRHERTLVVFYPLATGKWVFAELNGSSVIHFGPFDSRKVVEELLLNMYPETPSVELSTQRAMLDDDAVSILGYAAARQVVGHEETGE